MNAVLLIAHAPLAHALRQGALHVLPDAHEWVAAVDVEPSAAPEETEALARAAIQGLPGEGALILTDMFGATPSNVAQRLGDAGRPTRLIAGVNLPMLVRALSYRHEDLDALCARALAGGTQSILAIHSTAPQHQPRRTPNDQDRSDHHQ